MQDLESSVRWGSAAAFYQQFAENPNGLHFWGEMAERLKMLNTPQFAAVKEWLTDRYDNFKVPSPIRYRKTGKKQDTPPIEFKRAPRINILATSSNDWFFQNLAQEDSTGGFLARWMIVHAEGERRDVAIPLPPDASLVADLARKLTRIAELRGEADLIAILPNYEKWYSDTKRRFEAQPNPALARAYFNRHRGHVLKLAVIFEASQSGTLKVSAAAWERAVEFAARIEKCIFEMLPTGMNAAGYDLQKIEERIRMAGSKGISHNDLTRCYQDMHPKEREQKLKTLLEAGRIFSGQEKTRGRPKTYYCHADFHQGGE